MHSCSLSCTQTLMQNPLALSHDMLQLKSDIYGVTAAYTNRWDGKKKKKKTQHCLNLLTKFHSVQLQKMIPCLPLTIQCGEKNPSFQVDNVLAENYHHSILKSRLNTILLYSQTTSCNDCFLLAFSVLHLHISFNYGFYRFVEHLESLCYTSNNHFQTQH